MVLCPECNSKIISEVEGTCSKCKKTGKLFVCQSKHRICSKCYDEYVFSKIHEICLNSTSCDSYVIFTEIIEFGNLRMHDFKHHVAVGAALLAAHRNAGTQIDLDAMLNEMTKRGRKIPPGSCGLMGNCGAAVSVGTFLSILTGTTPYSESTWGDVNLATARCLTQMGIIGGPRCCKRNSIIALKTGAEIARDKFGSQMKIVDEPVCKLSESNKECIKEKCPFYKN